MDRVFRQLFCSERTCNDKERVAYRPEIDVKHAFFRLKGYVGEGIMCSRVRWKLFHNCFNSKHMASEPTEGGHRLQGLR